MPLWFIILLAEQLSFFTLFGNLKLEVLTWKQVLSGFDFFYVNLNLN